MEKKANPMLEKRVKYCGLSIKEECRGCKSLDPSAKDNYLCGLDGSCPGFLTQEQKDDLVNNWDKIQALRSRS